MTGGQLGGLSQRSRGREPVSGLRGMGPLCGQLLRPPGGGEEGAPLPSVTGGLPANPTFTTRGRLHAVTPPPLEGDYMQLPPPSPGEDYRLLPPPPPEGDYMQLPPPSPGGEVELPLPPYWLGAPLLQSPPEGPHLSSPYEGLSCPTPPGVACPSHSQILI
ncbi:UNVERIFIED_CONTAM: hypothetical protein FKN15_043506 [Acipenser sinensis]